MAKVQSIIRTNDSVGFWRGDNSRPRCYNAKRLSKASMIRLNEAVYRLIERGTVVVRPLIGTGWNGWEAIPANEL